METFVAFAIDWEMENDDLSAILEECGATPESLHAFRRKDGSDTVAFGMDPLQWLCSPGLAGYTSWGRRLAAVLPRMHSNHCARADR
jgi:hypothetical protein